MVLQGDKMDIRNERLKRELEEFETLSQKELLRKKCEFQNIRILIDHELSIAESENNTKTEWFRKATTAYKLNGLKIAAIEGLIHLRSSKHVFYQEFHRQAKEVLPRTAYNFLIETCKRELNCFDETMP